MAKLKNPLFSLHAFGLLARGITLRRHHHASIIQRAPTPTDAKTLAQLSWRTLYQKAVALWHSLDPTEHAAWESQARPLHMTGFAYFMSQALRPNPGIYLPLLGGTMEGDISMDGHSITDVKSYASRSYLGTNQAIPTNTITVVELDNVDFDFQSEFNTSTYRYIATSPGLRLVFGLITYTDITNIKQASICFLKNGVMTLAVNQWQPFAAATWLWPVASDFIYLSASDYIQLGAWHNKGVDANVLSGSDRTFLGVYTLN